MLLPSQAHTHLLDGSPCSLITFKVDEAVAPGRSVGVGGHFAGQNVPEAQEGVVQRLVVDGGVQVLRSCGRAHEKAVRV